MHLKVKDLKISKETLFVLSTDGMVYRWGSLNPSEFQSKPQPVLSLIDFTIKAISVSQNYVVSLDSQDRVH